MPPRHTSARELTMLLTIASILLVLWVLGLIGGYAVGGGVHHLLLVIALLVVVLRVLSGRRRAL
jgi:hypothetical protein